MTKDDLKNRIDLVELISRTVKLKKNGASFKGLCPFHEDKNPSLCVYPDERRWECFGCGKKGDCYSWIQEAERTDFKGALDYLQREYGDGIDPSPSTRKETVWDITDASGNLLAQHVRVDLPGGRKTYSWRDKNGKPSKNGEIKSATLPLYRIKHLFDLPSSTIIITEGEKAADALSTCKDVASLGTVTGAASCPTEGAFTPLVGLDARICLWPDNDPPGFGHIEKVAKTLQKLGIEPYLIRWQDAPPKGDAYDFIAHGGNLDELLSKATPWPNGNASMSQPVATDEGVEQSIRLLTGHTIRLKAEDIRKERTGVHARVSIFSDASLLSWDVFNIQRNEERNRLAKSAVDRMPEGLDTLCDAVTLKGYLDQFAAVMWDRFAEHDMPTMVTPPETIPPLVFMVKPYVLQGGGTIMFAPPGAGKSYTGLLLAVSVDAGVNKLWLVKQSKVLFVNLERSADSMKRRLAMVNKILDLPVTRPLLMLNRRGRSLADVAEVVKRAIKRDHVQLVILDSISRSGTGDLTSNEVANRTIDTLNSLCETWFCIGHTPRSDESHVYGGIHFDAGADVMVQLSAQRKGNEHGVGLTVTKANDIPTGDMDVLAFTFDADYGLQGARKANASEFGELCMNKKQSPTQEVINYLLEKGEASASDIADSLGRNRSNISALLNSSDEFVKTRKTGKAQLWAVRGEEPH